MSRIQSAFAATHRAARWVLLLLLLAPGLQAQWMAGASSQIINPDTSAYIAGHTLNRKFKGVHDNIYVKALVVSDINNSVSLLTFDCIGLLYPELQEIRKAIQSRIQDPLFQPGHIVISSTHTHTGPDVVGLWGPDRFKSGVDAQYMSALVAASVTALEKAWMARVPVRTQYAVTVHGGGWVYNISRPAEIDRSLTILRFMDAGGSQVASLTNFACHPTILDGAFDEVSSDYVAGFYQRMDSVAGGVNLFLQGPIGGWVQPENEEKSFAQAFFRGRGLADAAIQALANPKPLRQGDIKFLSRQVKLKVENPGFRILSQAGVIKRAFADSVETEIAVFKFGSAFFATHPGETIPQMGLETKKLMPGPGPKFVLGLGMDALGYILDKDFFTGKPRPPHADYLCSMSLGPNTSKDIMQIIRSMLGSSPLTR